nr:MAG TPA: hypothetical protein [Caudoviricetes sp.]
MFQKSSQFHLHLGLTLASWSSKILNVQYRIKLLIHLGYFYTQLEYWLASCSIFYTIIESFATLLE